MALLPRAIAASASAQQTAVICGPSLGGLLYGLGPATVYATCTAIFIAASVLIQFRRDGTARASTRRVVSLETVFAGFAYIRSHPILLGAISLDLFAVLLGGVTALLPIYARDILHAGPWALGLLRSAPAVGALAISIVLAHRAIAGRAGRVMFAAVGLFGLASLLFATVDLDLAVVPGARDLRRRPTPSAWSSVSRWCRCARPHDMLGRVMAVNSMFTGSSGSLGEFRAGGIEVDRLTRPICAN